MNPKENPQRPFILHPDDMSDGQRQLRARIESGARKSVPPNLEIWLNNLPFADVAERFGEYVSQRASMSRRVKEIVILTVAQVWNSEFERFFHERIGQQVGLTAAQINALRDGADVAFDDPVEQVSYEVVRAVAKDNTVPDALYTRAMEVLGHVGLSDIVGLMGLYSMIAWSVCIYRVPLPVAPANPA